MTKDITQHLSIKDKVKLFKELYTELSGYGCDGDTELAHINPYEAQLLKSIGGSGTVNQITGLREYKGGGSPPPPPPATQSVTQQSEFPEELKPFIKDVLGKAQAIQQKRESEGYIPFEGPQVASFTPEQEQAFAGISGLVGQGEQYFDPATRLAAASAISPRQAEVEQFMSPYMQNVVEIQQREAQRQADVAAQQLGAQAVGAGGFGGSRQAILEAEQQRNLQQQLGDIQARGLAAAYEDAQRRIAEQRGRELAASGQFMQLGQVAPAQQQRELTALEAVGAQRQAQSQRGLDIARQQFQEEQTFPERTLQQYQSVIRGFPLAPTTYETRQTTTPAPSFLQQAAGLGTTAIGLAGAFGGFGRNAKAGGLVSRMGGGQVDQSNGLGSIVVKKQVGGGFAGMPIPPTQTLPAGPLTGIVRSTKDIEDAVRAGRMTMQQANQEKLKLLSKKASLTADELAQLNKLRGIDFEARRKEAETDYEKGMESIASNKWLSLANAGFNILSQPGGTTAFEGIGKGFTQSGFTKDIMEAAKEERALAREKKKELRSISDAELDNMARISGITRQEADNLVNAQIAEQDIKIDEATAGIAGVKDIRKAGREDVTSYLAEKEAELDYRAALAKAKGTDKTTLNQLATRAESIYKTKVANLQGVNVRVLPDGTRSVMVDRKLYGENANKVQTELQKVLDEGLNIAVNEGDIVKASEKMTQLLENLGKNSSKSSQPETPLPSPQPETPLPPPKSKTTPKYIIKDGNLVPVPSR